MENEAASPGFWDRQSQAQSVISRSNALRAVINPYDKLATQLEEVDLLIELAEAEDDETERELAEAEAARTVDSMQADLNQLELRCLLGGELDANNAYVSIHAGAGGTESCDWADMLLRMIRRYAERHGFEMVVLDIQAGDEAGIKSATVSISGAYAYGYLQSERGVHRLVRISPFDAAKRRHTSFSSLDVVAEIDDNIDVEINDADLRIDTFRASGAGGQHVNTTDSAIRITHAPTGIVVQCQAERSQHANRARAMKMLQARLYEYERDKQRAKFDQMYGDKGEIAWGSQIRSYVLQPYTMAKDHRTDYEVGNVQAVLDGDLDGFIEAYLRWSADNAQHS